MYLDYTESENSLTIEELRHLAGSLGFPRDVFEKNIPKELIDKSNGILIKDFIKCVDERCFHVDLHFTVNLKSGSHNAKFIKKAVQFILKEFLSFKEVLDVRLAFQAYEEYDQKGMRIDEYTFLRTLKMCGRVISPKKLMYKVKHLKLSYQEQGRIQIFEFLDLLALCELSDKYHITYDLNSPVDKTWTKLYKVDNFKQFTIPKDKKLWKHLNKEYKEKELNYNRPELTSSQFTEYPLKFEDFRTQVRLSNSHYEMLHRSLRNSNKQVKLAKGGFTFARPQTTARSRDISKHEASGSRNATLTTPAASQRSSPTMCLTPSTAKPSARLKRAHRPQSSPPVISDRVLKDSKAKVENVKFDMCTEHQRWSEHYLANISSHLPNYHDVLRRMVKPPPAPRRKRYYRRERPSPKIITKLASHEPQPPPFHIERCDALTQGIGIDQHSVALKSQAKKIRCKSAPVTSLRQKSASSTRSGRKLKYSALLESLLRAYDYTSDDSEVENDETVIQEENTEDEESDVLSDVDEGASEDSDEEKSSEHGENQNFDLEQDKPLSDSETKQKFIEEYFKWKRDKHLHIKNFVENSGYYRTCLKPGDRPHENYKTKPASEHEISSEYIKPDTSPRKLDSALETISEFEKHILDPENLRIPHDVLLVEEAEDYYEKRRRHRSLKRLSKRYPVEDRKWFMSAARIVRT